MIRIGICLGVFFSLFGRTGLSQQADSDRNWVTNDTFLVLRINTLKFSDLLTENSKTDFKNELLNKKVCGFEIGFQLHDVSQIEFSWRYPKINEIDQNFLFNEHMTSVLKLKKKSSIKDIYLYKFIRKHYKEKRINGILCYIPKIDSSISPNQFAIFPNKSVLVLADKVRIEDFDSKTQKKEVKSLVDCFHDRHCFEIRGDLKTGGKPAFARFFGLLSSCGISLHQADINSLLKLTRFNFVSVHKNKNIAFVGTFTFESEAGAKGFKKQFETIKNNTIENCNEMAEVWDNLNNKTLLGNIYHYEFLADFMKNIKIKLSGKKIHFLISKNGGFKVFAQQLAKDFLKFVRDDSVPYFDGD